VQQNKLTGFSLTFINKTQTEIRNFYKVLLYVVFKAQCTISAVQYTKFNVPNLVYQI